MCCPKFHVCLENASQTIRIPPSRRKRKILKFRNYWSVIRHERKLIARSRICAFVSEFDPRPYALVNIGGVEINGLLDSGASISALGCDALNFLAKVKLPFKPISESIFTADGASQQILGVAYTEVSYLLRTRKIKLYIVPSLSQPLYLEGV